MQDHLPQCPRCGGNDLTLISTSLYANEPDRKTLYAYKCVCGLAFTSNDKPKNPLPGPPPSA
jgi:hypothetical protein